MAKTLPVPPDAVRLWLGYKSKALTYPQFYAELGSTFVPACATLEPKLGLTAYYSALPKLKGATSNLPDQTALMFWKNAQAHGQAQSTLAERAYLDLHQIVYDVKACQSLTPTALKGAMKLKQAYYLINRPADWMQGGARHLLGARPAKVKPADFSKSVTAWAAAYQKAPSPGADGALLYATQDMVVFWEHWPAKPAAADHFDALAAQVTPFLKQVANPATVPDSLWKSWPGLKLAVPDCLNIQFKRVQVKS
jgi:hypothetical protein